MFNLDPCNPFSSSRDTSRSKAITPRSPHRCARRRQRHNRSWLAAPTLNSDDLRRHGFCARVFCRASSSRVQRVRAFRPLLIVLAKPGRPPESDAAALSDASGQGLTGVTVSVPNVLRVYLELHRSELLYLLQRHGSKRLRRNYGQLYIQPHSPVPRSAPEPRDREFCQVPRAMREFTMRTNMPIVTARRRASERGSAMVELSLCFLLVFSLIYALMEFSRVVYCYNILAGATREASRYAMVHGSKSGSVATASDIQAQVARWAIGLDTSALTRQYHLDPREHARLQCAWSKLRTQ